MTDNVLKFPENTSIIGDLVLIPIRSFKWFDDNYSWMRHLTCVNHPTALYYTKNPFDRGIHVIRVPDGMHCECDCKFDELRAITDPNGVPHGMPERLIEENRKEFGL